jgi:hypothetical protein
MSPDGSSIATSPIRAQSDHPQTPGIGTYVGAHTVPGGPAATPGYSLNTTPFKEAHVLFAIALILLIIAVLGGIVVHPLLFLIAILAVVALLSGRGGTAVGGRRGFRRGPIV